MRSAFRAVLAAVLLAVVAAVPGGAAASRGSWETSLPFGASGWSSADLFRNGVGFVSSGSGPIYKTSDDGLTWIPLVTDLGAGSGTRSSFATPEEGFASTATDIARTEDGGLTWARLPAPPPPRGIDRMRLDAPRAVPGTDDVMITGWGLRREGECRQVRSHHYLLRSSNGGDGWRRTDLGFPGFGLDLDVLDEDHAVVLVHEFGSPQAATECAYAIRTYRSSVLVTEDGGRTFKEVHSAFFDDEDPVVAVAMPTRRRIVLGTEGGHILLSNNGGRSFRKVARLTRAGDQTTVQRIDAIAFAGPSIGYAGTNGIGMWRTEDGGRTWRREPSPFEIGYDSEGMDRGAIAAAGRKDALAVGPAAVARRISE